MKFWHTSSKLTQAPAAEAQERLIRRYAALAFAAGLIPIPGVDLLTVGSVQMKMLHALARAYGIIFSHQLARALAASVLGAALPATGAAALANSLSKFVPGYGSAVGMAGMSTLSAAATYALGQLFSEHFANGGTLEDFTPPPDWREQFMQAMAEYAARAAGNTPPPPAPTAPAAETQHVTRAPRLSRAFKLWLFLLAGAGLSIAALMIALPLDAVPAGWLTPKPLHIALAGPQSGTGAANGQEMLKAATLALAEFNQQGGVAGHPVVLHTFDDQNNATRAEEFAMKIASDPNLLAVIGHYNSAASLAASPIYKRHGVPAITGSATHDALTADNDWYFRVIFNNSDQVALLGNFIRNILGHEQVHVVYENDAYGQSILESLRHTAQTLDLRIGEVWRFEPDRTDFPAMLEQLTSTMTKMEKPDAQADNAQRVLFVATHAPEAIEIITSLKKEHNLTIVGADVLASKAFREQLREKYPQERIRPGYYTDGIYATFPYLQQLAGGRARSFERQFKQKYGETPSAAAAMYYDTTITLLTAMKQAGLRLATPVETQRKQLRDALWNLASVGNAVEGVTGTIYFDKHGNAVKNIPVGLFQNGHIVPANEQYQLVNDLGNADTLLQEAIAGQVIFINGKYLRRAQVVYTGVDFIDIDEVDIANATFTANFFLWFRHHADFEEENIGFLNLYQPIKMLESALVDQKVQTVAGEMILKTYRVKGRFKADLDFRDFPLDRQVLPIRFRHNELVREKLIYVADTLGLQLNSEQARQAANQAIKLTGWQVNDQNFFQDTKFTLSTFGIPEFIDTHRRVEFSQFNAEMEIQRDQRQVFSKYVMPLAILLLLGQIALLLPITAIGARMTMLVGVLLFAALFHTGIQSAFPLQNQLMLVEYGFFLVYGAVAASMAASAVLYALHHRARHRLGLGMISSLSAVVLNWLARVLYLPITLWAVWRVWQQFVFLPG